MLCIIQARMSSKRLPKKMLMLINGKTLIERVVSQIKKSKHVKKIIIAISNHTSDDELYKFCKKKNYNIFRGSLNNVAKRFYDILINKNYFYFLRISGDSPLIDNKLIDNISRYTFNNKYDLITNVLKRTYPKGQSIEFIKTKTFLENFKNIKTNDEKEHMTKFFYKNKNYFKIKSIELKKNLNKFNFCIDNNKDLIRINKLIFYLKNKIPNFRKLTQYKI